MKISIIIPAHNEENRIKRTLQQYCHFFKSRNLNFECVVVLNGCVDNTLAVVQEIQFDYPEIIIVDLKQAGKGLAIKAGFENALTRQNDLIGYVDADMATKPEYFYDLIEQINGYDGIIASRYMPGAHVEPPRPWIKRWGSKIIYEPLVYLLFGLKYYDLQCGAKLFKRKVIETITPHLTVTQWAFDVEVLYLCKKYGFTIKEIPTTWQDQTDSKLKMRSGFRMLGNLFKMRMRH